jgi:hypothetical protein
MLCSFHDIFVFFLAAGYGSLFALMDKLLNIHDQQLSVQVSRMLGQHSEEILNSICAYQLNLVASHGKNNVNR